MTEVDDLYAVVPEEFVAARSALVKQLKADGQKDEAAVVAKLKRPSAVAWALNQVARNDPDVVEAAIEAGQQLRAASDDAVAGKPEQLRAATAAERKAANALDKAAGAHLGARAGSLQTAVLSTIRVAALDDAVADGLRRGVLSSEHSQPGFGFDLGDSPPVARPPAKAKRPKLTVVPDLEPEPEPEPDAEEQERRKAERAAARDAERSRKKQLRRRIEEARRLTKEATRLAKEADEAEQAAQAARAQAAAAEKRAQQAQAAVDEL